jgi:multidrug/hemolysin transport system permease protein
MTMLVKRNLKLYFRDRINVFFSILSILVVFGLYLFFLGDNYIRGMNYPGIKYLMDSWVMAGILAITGMTTTLGAAGAMVDDRTRGISKDFLSSPVRRSRIVGGYLVSSFIIGIIMSLLTFFLAELYIVIRGGRILGMQDILKVLAVIPLSVVSSGTMTFFVVLFLKTSSAFGTVSTIIGTVIGFLTGIYVPIGYLGKTLQFLVKIFPPSYAGSLFRKIMMKDAILQTFAAAPQSMVEDFEKSMGVFYQFNGRTVSTQATIVILVAVTLLFLVLSIAKLSRMKDF